MPTNSAFDEYFKQAAARLAQNRTNVTSAANPWANFKPTPQPTALDQTFQTAGNLGQGILDFLSTGTYAVAGIGNRIGESVNKLNKGDFSNVLQDVTPLYNVFAAAKTGVETKRTWSDNLRAIKSESIGLNPDEVGLVLDIVLDPTWLIPGGIFAKGITGTVRGIEVASRLNQVGAKLTPEIIKGVQTATEGFARPGLRNLPKQAGDLGILSDIIKPTGQKISAASTGGLQNFYQGIKQANIENYSEWSAARHETKMARLDSKIALQEEKNIDAQSRLGLPSTLLNDNNAVQATETIVKAVDDKVVTPTVSDQIKDAGSEQDAIEATARKGKKVEPAKAAVASEPKVKAAVASEPKVKAAASNEPIYTRAARELGDARTAWQKRVGLDYSPVDYAAVKASVDASEMAKVYDKLISDPTNPDVIAAYTKFMDEATQQYKYMTEELGIKVEYIKEDPYNVTKVDGTVTPDSRLMMADVLDNKTLKVRDSSIDFVDYPHPLLTAEQNNIFRAVHDFFGHAASGRSFNADGEEAAWVAHSSMFTPEARRVMTTETRGQNSYYNFFDSNNKQFAEQKAALFPEEYTLLPAELDLVTGQALVTNTFFGRLTNVLSEVSDYILDDLGLVQTPLKNKTLYSKEEISKLKTNIDKIIAKGTYKEGSPEYAAVVTTLEDLIKKINVPNIKTGFVETLNEFKKSSSLEILQQVLDRPIIVTSLLKDLAKAEGRELAAPAAFKPTYWGAKSGKTSFTTEVIAKYFSDDELLTDIKKLDIAMGKIPLNKAKIYARKGETAAQAYQRYQATIWEDFRARNIDNLENVAAQEKVDWDLKWQQADSEIFTETSVGQLVGIGKLPEALPYSVLSGSFNGLPATTLGRMIENIGSIITREPVRATPGTENIRLVGGTPELATTMTEPAFLKGVTFDGPKTPQGLVRYWDEKDINTEMSSEEKLNLAESILNAEEGNLSLAVDLESFAAEGEAIKILKGSKTKGALFDVVDKNGEKLLGIVTLITSGKKLPTGSKLIPTNAAAKKVMAALRKNKSNIKVDNLNQTIKEWLIFNLRDTLFNIKQNGVRDVMSATTKADIDANATKLLDLGIAKSFADAKLAVTGGADALRLLGAKPAMKLYVKDRAELRATSSMGKRQLRPMLTRDPATGLPIDKNNKIVSEAKAENAFPGLTTPQFRMTTSTGQDFTGRSAGKGSQFAEQTGVGKQQLAGIEAARAAISGITTGVKAKEFMASPEQASLLANVMTTLGIKVADNATPQAIFKQFEKEAAITFDEMISKIQSAAKSEAVIYQARAVFNRSIEENISLMKAIDSLDPSELQQSVVKFTEDAIALVDDYCAMQYVKTGRPQLSATEFLQQISQGSISKGIIQ